MQKEEAKQLAVELAEFFSANIQAQLTLVAQDQELARHWKVQRDTFPCDKTFREAFDKLCMPWTYAVHRTLKAFAGTKRDWRILPPDKPFQKEYLCDFTLFQGDKACRVACESQWTHGSSRREISWAFDKLRGVKANVKLFIFEGAYGLFQSAVEEYLAPSEQVGPDEVYLALRWTGKGFEASMWQTGPLGIQAPNFQRLPLS